MGNCTARPAASAEEKSGRENESESVVVMVSPARSTPAASSGSSSGSGGPKEKAKPRTLPLSPLDCALCVRGLVVHWAFMYPHDLDGDLLRASLAAALVDFPVLAGRARITAKSWLRHDMEVVLNDRGVAFATARSASTLANLSGPERAGAIRGPDNLTPPAFLTPMDALRVERGREPLMAVKLTRLSGGGCVVGMSWVGESGEGRGRREEGCYVSLLHA